MSLSIVHGPVTMLDGQMLEEGQSLIKALRAMQTDHLQQGDRHHS